MKLLINRCYGGFGLSREAFLRLRELGHKQALKEPDIGEPWGPNMNQKRERHEDNFLIDIKRTDPLLIKVVEELGCEKASYSLCSLKIIEVPDDLQWEIDNYDGMETVIEANRRYWS